MKKNNDKYIDMHIHSCYSDGELSPLELIELAINNNVGVMAITDHDTINGIKKVDRNNSKIIENNLKIINGIELTAKVKKGRMHILGYDINLNNVRLNKKMIELKDNSINSVLSIIEQIKRDYNIKFGYEDIKTLVNANHNLGRPDIARLCVKYGYASSVSDAFDKYLIEARKKTIQYSKGIPFEECLELIKNSGGIPVLAHPYTLELSYKELLEQIKNMINYGLEGIEVYHSQHNLEEVKCYLEIANKYNLLVSGGSDFHGNSVKPDIELGYGKNNNLKIKQLSILNKLT